MKQIALVVLAASASLASADPPVATSKEPPKPGPAEPAPEAPPVPQAPQPDANDVSGAPLPGNESGRVDPGEPGDSAGRQGARVVLFLPKVLFEIAMLPFDGAAYLEGKYQLEDMYYRMFYYRDRTLGFIPTATYVTGLGFTAGLRFFDLDTFGRRERLILQATTGGNYRVGLLASLDTGDRLGPLRIEASGNFDRRPTEPFYGIGNEGHLQGTASDVDAFINPTAVQTFYRYQEARVAVLGDLSVVSHLHLDVLGTLTQLEYSSDTQQFPSIEDVYEPFSLVGFGTTTNRFYGQLGLTWDGRGTTTVWEPSTVHATGTYASLYGGISHPVYADDGETFWHYGLEAQQYIRLGFGPRALIVRFHGEGVTELDRRDSAQRAASARRCMVSTRLRLRSISRSDRDGRNASVHVVADREHVRVLVRGRRSRVPRLERLHLRRVACGLRDRTQVYTPPTFVADLQLASSSDGGIAVTAEFSPILDSRQRWR